MSIRILQGDCRGVLPTLPANSVQCVVTSPPYWGLRDYGVEGQLGLEATPEDYLETMVGVFRAVRRVLRDDGTLWLNMGDGYWCGNAEFSSSSINKAHANGVGGRGRIVHDRSRKDLKPKDLIGMPWRLAFALQADGWFLRADIIWAKPNPMPESVTDRPTKAHEYVFLLSKSARYFYDANALREPLTAPDRTGSNPLYAAIPTHNGRDRGRGDRAIDSNPAGHNCRSVWTIPSEPFREAHFATFPRALASRCIQAGTSEKGCCAACGAPWVREMERTAMVLDRSPRTHAFGRTRTSGTMLAPPTSQMIGWQPSCACDAGIVPCVVLDPFGGSGTVGRVAEDLGRDAILIELSAAYVAMAKQRTAQRTLFASPDRDTA